jgi:hypothetical protein
MNIILRKNISDFGGNGTRFILKNVIFWDVGLVRTNVSEE